MKIRKYQLLTAVIVILYLLTHFWNLTGLPIFSDEAIYIRWSQLILDDPGRYLFFALNDGKTPLFIWLLAPFQLIFADKLFAARIITVLVGLAQIFTVKKIVQNQGGSLVAQCFGMILFTILPFWYFHHRIALMDGMLVLFISLAVYFAILISNQLKKKNILNLKLVLATAIALVASLLTKIPAVLAFPAIGLVFLSNLSGKNSQRLLVIKSLSLIFGLAFILIMPLLLVPSAPQLFNRGSDFLMPVSSFLAGGYKNALSNIPNYLFYFSYYLSPFLLIIIVAGLFRNPRQRLVHQYFWSGVLFSVPIMLLGLVVYSRYLLPAALFFTIASIFATEGLVLRILPAVRSRSQKKLSIGIVCLSILGIMIANAISSGVQFMSISIVNPDETPFLSSDREQYLEKWSSGHGIKEIYEAILSASQSKNIAVATEGYFGTLPDGLLAYIYGQNQKNISIDGIGQPISSIPEGFLNKSKGSDLRWLVVNSDRLLIEFPRDMLIKEYCRPNNAPCLQVWDITAYDK